MELSFNSQQGKPNKLIPILLSYRPCGVVFFTTCQEFLELAKYHQGNVTKYTKLFTIQKWKKGLSIYSTWPVPVISLKVWKRPSIDAPVEPVVFAILSLFDFILTNWQTDGNTGTRKHGLTERRKHGTDSISSTADTGGNNERQWIVKTYWLVAICE